MANSVQITIVASTTQTIPHLPPIVFLSFRRLQPFRCIKTRFYRFPNFARNRRLRGPHKRASYDSECG